MFLSLGSTRYNYIANTRTSYAWNDNVVRLLVRRDREELKTAVPRLASVVNSFLMNGVRVPSYEGRIISSDGRGSTRQIVNTHFSPRQKPDCGGGLRFQLYDEWCTLVTEARRGRRGTGVAQGGEIDSGERCVYSASASRRIVVAISRSNTPTSCTFLPPRTCTCVARAARREREGERKPNSREYSETK